MAQLTSICKPSSNIRQDFPNYFCDSEEASLTETNVSAVGPGLKIYMHTVCLLEVLDFLHVTFEPLSNKEVVSGVHA